MDCRPHDSSIHGILQARVLELGAIALDATGTSWSPLCGLKVVKPPVKFGERTWDCSPGHAGKDGPHLAIPVHQPQASSIVHRTWTGKSQFSFQSQRKTMPKNVQTTAQLHSSHTLAGEGNSTPLQYSCHSLFTFMHW